MPKINLKKLIFGIVIGLGAVLLLLAFGIKVASQIHDKTAPVSSVPYAAKISYTIDSSKENQTVFSALKDLADKNNFEVKYNYKYAEFGVFVESIAGNENGRDDKYWQYWVNDKLGEAAADKKEVKAGDRVEWRFEKAPGM